MQWFKVLLFDLMLFFKTRRITEFEQTVRYWLLKTYRKCMNLIFYFLHDNDYIKLFSLRSKVEGLSSDKLQYVAVEPQNVFFTFISNPEDCENGRNLNLVTFSFPRLNEIKSRYFECKSITKATKKKMNAIKEEGAMNNLKREEIQQLLKRNFESYKEELQYIDPTNMFKDNEILIGNYRFIKDSQSQWVLREISHINSQEAWPKIFR